MRPAIVVLAVLGLIAIFLWVHKRRTAEKNESLIRLCIPLSGPTELDTAGLMNAFQDQWGIGVVCEENRDWADPGRNTRRYVLTDGKNVLLLSAHETPLPKNLLEITAQSAPNMTGEQKSALLDHKAIIMVEYVTGSDEPIDRVWFATKALLTLLKLTPAVGYINVSGQLYHSKEMVKPFLDTDSLDPSDLFLLCIATQVVGQDGCTWIHTHGMEQFGLPDIEVKSLEEDKAPYHSELIANAAIYSIHRGPIMEAGDTAALAGDGVMYDIKSPSRGSKRHFGHYGAIEISRQQEHGS